MVPLETLLSSLPDHQIHLFACDCAEHILLASALPGAPKQKALSAISAKRAWVEGRCKEERLLRLHREVWQAAQQIQTALQVIQGVGASLAKRSDAWRPVGVMWSATWASQTQDITPLELAVTAAYNAASASQDAVLERAWQLECLQERTQRLLAGRLGLFEHLVRRWHFLEQKAPLWREELETALFSS